MNTRPATVSTSRLAHRIKGSAIGDRMVPEEIPVAFSFAGTTHAVMMASPADFEDFALGFCLTEGIVSSAQEIERVDMEPLDPGVDVRVHLKDAANTRFTARRRRLAGPVGCGLCGIESIEEAMRAVAPVGSSTMMLDAGDIVRSVKLLSKVQPLHAETGAVHAAAFYIPGKGIVAVREDVGRHNALDKLAGALARCLIPGFDGAIFSIEWKEALWSRFFMAAPRRRRRSVERYKIVKRA